VKTDFGTTLSLEVIITYAGSQGPQFEEKSENYPVQPITCSAKDESWQLVLPNIVG